MFNMAPQIGGKELPCAEGPKKCAALGREWMRNQRLFAFLVTLAMDCEGKYG